MANYGYEHIADEAQRYLATHDAFRQLGCEPTHKQSATDCTPIVPPTLDEIIDKVKEIG